MMAAALAKAVYLRRYLSDDKKEKKKKKKKSKRPSRFQIVDDDVDLKSLLPENSNNFLEQEDEDDAPTVAQFVDERPVHVRAMEEYQNTKRWKTVVEHKENQTDDNEAKRTLFLNNHISQHHCDKNQSPMGLENLAAKDGSCSQAQASEGSGSSHSPRSLHGLDREAESKDSGCKKCFSKNVRYGCTSCGNRGHTKRQHKSSMQRRDCESSPSLQGISCGSDLSLSVQEHSRNSSDDDRYWSSLNSARNGSYTTAREKISSTISCLPDLNEKRDSVERRELSVSVNLLSHQPVPRKRHDSDSDDSLRTVHIKGLNSGGLCVNLVSATKECSSSLDPSGEKSHESGSDQSPPRRRRLDSGSDQSPLRNNNSGSNQKGDFGFDQSPTRKKRHDSGSDQSPQMRQSHVSNQSKLNSNKDLSPPRRGRQSMQNRSRKSKWNQDLDIECSEKSQNAAQKSRPSVLYDDKGRPQKTLSGARAGLCSAAEMKKEAAVLREREEKNFKQLSDEVIGKNAETVFRTKSGSRRNLETERRMKKDDDERKAEADKKYLEWNKGLKQKEMQEQALVDHIHEMSKPLARYKDDKDLDKMLREDERDGDPMLAFIKRRKKDKTIDKPQYKGPAPLPNRFKIPPGYRWDGVDRSNGFEQKLFSHIADKRATAAIAYKWSIEEM